MKKSYNGVLLAYRFWRKRTLLDGFFNCCMCLYLGAPAGFEPGL